MKASRLLLTLAAVAVVSSGCTSSEKTIKKDSVTAPKPEKTGTSGTRLKVRSIKAEDGATMTLGFYDSELDLNCAFRTTADGNKHCIPDGGYFVEGTHWADAQCTASPLTVIAVGCKPPPYFYKGDAACGGDTGVQVFRAGPLYTGKVYAGNGPGDCHLASSTWTDPTQIGLAGLGEEMPASSFVAGDEVTDN